MKLCCSLQGAEQLERGEQVDDEDGGLAAMDDEDEENGVAERGGLAGIARQAFSRSARGGGAARRNAKS
ncbi:hypothetical protein T484DRAFT_2641885 [Baffinella frigidus]|nr:hypothetical protein T484DRAFT_2641885 [Cryptophyta sp. CCMP2293]